MTGFIILNVGIVLGDIRVMPFRLYLPLNFYNYGNEKNSIQTGTS
jgi:hypothetical protein